ncbi:MAG: hypothetical protein L6R41_001577 [Letrouitia leprolyta]|nr:MAG: hypothetical protein L6R41_001577 [Letrouitia leprolyta]
MSNRFFFDGSDSSDSGEDNLPYPEPLARSAFLTPDFDPATFLSSLRNRHQTLEDLRAELRTRSQDISKELLDLVNDNYQDFLSLGSSLKGGDEKVEEVRLGLLGFKREVEGLKVKVDERKKEVEDLVAQRKEIRRQMQLGRSLLDVDYRLQELERSLMVASTEASSELLGNDIGQDISDGEDDSDDGQGGNASTARLDRHVRQYLLARRAMDRIGPTHPSIIGQEGRITRIKNTILLDLGNALKQLKSEDTEQATKLLGAYRDLDESQEALKILKERKA